MQPKNFSRGRQCTQYLAAGLSLLLLRLYGRFSRLTCVCVVTPPLSGKRFVSKVSILILTHLFSYFLFIDNFNGIYFAYYDSYCNKNATINVIVIFAIVMSLFDLYGGC